MPLVEKWREQVFIIKKGKEHIEENDRNTAEKITAPASCSANPYSGNVQLRIIGETLNILSRNERFVIETHLVYHHTWTETMTLFSEENGPGCGRSERTLKRIQSRALKKMVNFINRSQLKEYFHKT